MGIFQIEMSINQDQLPTLCVLVPEDSFRLSSSVQASTGSSFNSSWSSHLRLRALFVLTERTIHEYNFLIAIALTLDLVSVSVQSYLVYAPQNDIQLGMCIAGVLITVWACINYILLLWKPSKDLCVCSLMSATAIEVVYAIQIVYYYVALSDDESVGDISFGVVIVIVWFILQFLPLVVLYRFWEYLMYNYDDSRAISVSSFGGSPRPEGDHLRDALVDKMTRKRPSV